MKKITLLFLLFAVSLGYAQTLPLDFSVVGDLFSSDASGGDAIQVSIINEELSVESNGQPWDNVFLDITPIDLSNDAANTITLKIRSTTAVPGEVHYHRINIGGPELDFFTTGLEEKIVILDFQGSQTAAAGNIRIFLDAGYQPGFDDGKETYLIDDITGPIVTPPTCDDGIQNGDEAGVDCGGTSTCGPCDVAAPTGFTAVAGTVGAFSVELLLTATDDVSDITYDVTYEGGGTAQTTGASGVETPLVIGGLTPENTYNFVVTASDASGNVNTVPITVPVTTLVDDSTDCKGFTNQAVEGSFTIGIEYEMTTISDTEVLFEMTLLDTDKIGLAPEVFIPGFGGQFFGMTPGSGPGLNYTRNVTGFTAGSDVTFFFRIVYQDGLVRSREFIYTIGDTCFPNDVCADATPVVLDGSTINVNNVGATDSGEGSTCGTGTVADVWYSFVADGPEVFVITDAPNFSILEGSCGSLTEVECNPSSNTAITVTSGNTYYVRITDDGTIRRAPGDFTFRISGSVFSNNDFILSDFKVSPNPTKNVWEVNASVNIDTINVFDILGKRVISLSPNNQKVSIDASNLRTGIYLAQFSSNGATKTVKLVRN